MNEENKKIIASLDELEGTGYFNLIIGRYKLDEPNPKYYNESFKVCCTLSEDMTIDEISHLIALSYKVVDDARKEHEHALSHPNKIKSLFSYLKHNQ